MLGRRAARARAAPTSTRGRRREALARLPAAGADLHRRARRACATCSRGICRRDGDAAQPVPRVDRRAAARRRLRLGAPRRPGRAPRMAWHGRARQPHGERRLRRDVHGGGARRVALGDSMPPSAPTSGSSVVPPRSRLAEAMRFARELDGEWEERRRRSSTSATARYHWVHAINNTALVAAALYAFDDFSPAICGVVQGGWTPTRTAPPSARSSVRCGPIEERWSEPLHGRFSSSLPGFDGITLDELVAARRSRSHDGVRPARPAADRPADAVRSTALELDNAKIIAAPDDPADWPAWRDALAAGARRRARGATTAARTSPSSRGRRAASPSRSSGSGTSGSTTTRRSGSRPSGCSTRPSGVRRLRRRRALACVPGDRHRRAQPVRLVPRRARDPRARGGVPGARCARVRRLQPVGRRHAARAGRRRCGGRGARARARRRRCLPRHDEGGDARAARGAARCGLRRRVDTAARADRAITISRGRSGSPTRTCPA